MTRKILVIDDDHEIVELIKAVLRTKAYEITVAYDGEEGFRLIQQMHPDMVITDLRMPKMSGMEFVKRVRAAPDIAETPILVISSITTGMDKPDAYWAAGLKSDDFLPKPFDPLSLLGRVEYLLRKHEYISEGAVPQEGGTGFAHVVPAGATRISELSSPEEVVRIFVESWNSRAFAREFDALGDEMTGGLSRTDYVERRTQLYQSENGDEVRQQVLDTVQKISSNMATVDCLREDNIRGIPRRKDERYTLKKTQAGWKIVAVKSKPLTFSLDS